MVSVQWSVAIRPWRIPTGHYPPTTRRVARGFTLIELLLAVGIIAMLIGLLMAALGRAREAGRGASCAAWLHQAAIATTCYLEDNDGSFWPYYQDVPGVGGGRRWWFGFERGGPPMNSSQRNRPLDKSAGFLGQYLSASAADFICPSFPYSASNFFRKFAPAAGGYGYNTAALGGFNLLDPSSRTSRKVQEFVGRTSDIFILADGIHFDRLSFSTTPPRSQPFNEPAYLQWQDPVGFSSNAGVNGGYAHFRHNGRAAMLMLDGHADSQVIRGMAHPFTSLGFGPVGNLSDDAGRVREVTIVSGSVLIDVIYGL